MNALDHSSRQAANCARCEVLVKGVDTKSKIKQQSTLALPLTRTLHGPTFGLADEMV